MTARQSSVSMTSTHPCSPEVGSNDHGHSFGLAPVPSPSPRSLSSGPLHNKSCAWAQISHCDCLRHNPSFSTFRNNVANAQLPSQQYIPRGPLPHQSPVNILRWELFHEFSPQKQCLGAVCHINPASPWPKHPQLQLQHERLGQHPGGVVNFQPLADFRSTLGACSFDSQNLPHKLLDGSFFAQRPFVLKLKHYQIGGGARCTDCR
jgi:hypothetical protein